MKLPLKEIVQGGLELDFQLPKETLNTRSVRPLAEKATGKTGAEADYVFTDSAKCSIKVNREGETVYLTGQVQASFSTQCSRCAEAAVSQVSSPVKLQFKPKSFGAAVGEEDEDLEISYYQGKELDLGEPIADFVMLQLPFSVLCSEGCKGLCSSCGVNLNLNTCDCVLEEEVEGPFAILKSVKIQ